MRKATVTISYDEEKLKALEIYLSKRGMNFDDELLKSIDALYAKNVPTAVKEFFEMKDEAAESAKKEVKNNGKQRSTSAV